VHGVLSLSGAVDALVERLAHAADVPTLQSRVEVVAGKPAVIVLLGRLLQFGVPDVFRLAGSGSSPPTLTRIVIAVHGLANRLFVAREVLKRDVGVSAVQAFAVTLLHLIFLLLKYTVSAERPPAARSEDAPSDQPLD